MAKLDLVPWSPYRRTMALWFALAPKFFHIFGLIFILSLIGSLSITNGPAVGIPMTLNSTEDPTTTEEWIDRSVIAFIDIVMFICGINSDHGVLVFAGATAYIFAEVCALQLCIYAILNNRPRALRPEIILNIAYASLQISAAIISITTIAMFGLEWLVQMMVNAKRARGMDLSADYIEEIRLRMPAACTLFIVLLLGLGGTSILSAKILKAYKRYLGTKIAAEAALVGVQSGGNAQATNGRPANQHRGK